MQYITQCSYKLHKSNYLLFQIVKEQPIAAYRYAASLQTCLRNLWVAVRQYLVEPIGIEPMTSCLQSRRSPS